MILIQASEKALAFHGDSQTALYLVNDLRESYQQNGMDMPKMLNDFVFNIEVALQDAGVLDEWFEENLNIDLDSGLSAINEGAAA